MKKIKVFFSILGIAALLTVGCVSCDKSGGTSQAPVTPSTNSADTNPENYIPITKMELKSSGIKDGIIDPQYGAASTDKLGAMPLESLPLEWSGAPSTAKSYAITIIDYDTVPIMGFPWIHWVTTNIDAGTTSLPANASTTMEKDMIQGVTSYANGYPLDLVGLKGFQVPREKAYHYGGMVPVNFPHKYTITVYALNTNLELKAGFGLNDLYNAMEGHVVGEGVAYGTYNAKIVKL